ncbi:hypothetical protein D3C87_815040 [compost metagenome]
MQHGQPSDDVLDQRIEKRLLSFRDSLELQLGKAMEVKLKGHFDAGVKILGWTFGLVALVFTLFGIKTAIDLREAARTTAIDEVKKKLAVDDSTSEFRRDVDRVIARGLISSYFLEMSRSKENPFALDLSISDTDLRRLIDLVKDSRSEDRDFRDAVDILTRSTQIKEGNSVSRLLLALGTAADEEFRWIRGQPDKRATVFELFLDGRLVQTARSLVGDDKTDKRLLIAATRYLAKMKDAESAKSLEKIAARSDEDIAHEAKHALARIMPESAVVSAALKIAQDASDEAIVSALRLAISVARPDRLFFTTDPKMATRNKLAAAVLSEVMARGYVLRLSRVISTNKMGLAISNPQNMSRLYFLPSRLINGPESELFGKIIRDSKDAKAVVGMLRSLCLEDDDRCHGVVHVSLEKEALIELSSGFTLSAADAPAGVYLRPRSPEKNADIIASWTDQDSNRKSLVFSKLINSNDMQFEIRSARALSEDLAESE